MDLFFESSENSFRDWGELWSSAACRRSTDETCRLISAEEGCAEREFGEETFSNF